jgi:sucrose phosphorylase
VNCTFYDAIGRNDLRYLLCRAIQFFLPGIPQVYYVGLLAGANDMELLARTQVGRDINRHYYSQDEIAAALERPVVSDLLELIRLRNTHPAFQGSFTLQPSTAETVEMCWKHGSAFARLLVDLCTGEHMIEISEATSPHRFRLLQIAAPLPAALIQRQEKLA